MDIINQLPNELLENIFHFLDGSSFCIARRVCKKWCICIDSKYKDRKLWQQFCISEIPHMIIEEMLSYKSIPEGDSVIDWNSLYRKWFRGRAAASEGAAVLKTRIQAFCHNPITCVKLSGSFVVTGHNNGCLCVWNQHDGSLNQRALVHLKGITDVVLVDLLNLGNFWTNEKDYWQHHHIITVSRDTIIKIKPLLEPINSTQNDLVLNVHGDVINSARIFGHQFVVHSRDNTVTVWRMKMCKDPFFHLEAELLHQIIGSEDIVHTLGFWHEELFCISNAGRLKSYNLEKNKWLEVICYKEYWSSQKVLTPITYYVFRDKTIIMFTVDGKMTVSVDDEFQSYHLMPSLRALIVSMSVKGTTLALGGENGKLYLFFVPEIESLLHLNLDYPTSEIFLSEASITSVDIVYEEDSPVIIASTTESIFVIKWQKVKQTLSSLSTGLNASVSTNSPSTSSDNLMR